MKSANNEYYDAWLPIYINEDNFEYNKQTILNSFSVLIYGNSGIEEYDFKPKYIFEILFKLLNQMITKIKNTRSSGAYLRAFFQYILLYNKLSKLYPDCMKENFNEVIFKKNNIFSNLCDLIIFTLFDKISSIENHLIKLIEVKKSKKAFELFYENEDCDLKSPQEFLQYLEDNNLYNNIAKAMQFEKSLFLYEGKNIDRRIKKIICTSFKKFVKNSDMNTREKVKKIIVENLKFNECIEFEKFFNNKLKDDTKTQRKRRRKNILNSLLILLYIKKKINEKNFIYELGRNFGVYLDIDETLKKLKEIVKNKDIYFDNEIENLYNRIKKLIEELLILDDGNIEKTERITELIKTKNKFHLLSLENFLFYNWKLFDDLYFYNKNLLEQQSLLFEFKIMKIDNLKLLYLYCYEKLEKSINRKNNNLSLIESMFIEISLNDNANKNCEWYNFICKKQRYDKECKKKFFNCTQFVSEYKKFISCFHKCIRLNEKLLLDDGKIMDYMFFSEFTKYIIKFSDKILDKKIDFPNLGLNKAFSIIDYAYNDIIIINKLKEIYDTKDITLLTFYELIILEIYRKIKYGFLSALKTQFLSDLTMKYKTKKLKTKQNGLNKRERKLNKKLDNKIYKLKTNKKDTFGIMKISLWKTRAPIKIQKSKFYKHNNK